MAMSGRVLVYGGKGALGSICVSHFKSKNFWVGSVDLAPNEQADVNILVNASESWTQQEKDVCEKVVTAVGDSKLDAVLCVAGGWAGGNASSEDFIKNSDNMWKQSVWSSAIAAEIAAKHLKEGGLLSLPGAQPAIQGTAGMIGYGMAKAAVHHLVKSLASDKSGLPANATAVATLPITLDTPMNRKWMKDADQSTWTPLTFIAEMFYDWTTGEKRPASGSLVQIITKDGKTDLIPV